MRIHIEKNKKFGVGYQARFVEIVTDAETLKNSDCSTPGKRVLLLLIDSKPFTLAEIVAEAQKALDLYNAEHKTDLEFRDIAWVDHLAIEKNAGYDPMSEKLCAAIKQDMSRITDIPDCESEEISLTGLQVVELMYAQWKEDGDEIAHRFVSRYCEYIAAHGYERGAETAKAKLESFSISDGYRWLKETYAQYVDYDDEAMNFIVGKAENICTE